MPTQLRAHAFPKTQRKKIRNIYTISCASTLVYFADDFGSILNEYALGGLVLAGLGVLLPLLAIRLGLSLSRLWCDHLEKIGIVLGFSERERYLGLCSLPTHSICSCSRR